MFRRTVISLVCVAVLATGCSDAAKISGSFTPTTSTTTTSEPTTTTTRPLDISNAPPGLVAAVEAFYAYASESDDIAPPIPDPVLISITPDRSHTRPSMGVASTGAFAGTLLATVELDADMFLAVDDGSGWRIVGGEWPSMGVPAFYGAGPRLIAVVGSDARPGETVEATRADSLHLIGLDGSGGGGVLGIPRDSYVPVPDMWTMKITESLAAGGPEALMAALEQLTDLPLEGYVLTGFAGFQDLIEVLGGVEVEVPFPINDSAAKAALSAGLQILDGFDALAFARARKTLPDGDFDRSEHQGVILLGAAQAVKGMGVSSVPALMEAAEPYLQTSLTPEQLLTFAVLAVGADLDSVPNVVTPGSLGTAGGASVVFLGDAARALFDDLADGNLED